LIHDPEGLRHAVGLFLVEIVEFQDAKMLAVDISYA
jgi:hypothetical protein